jgi:hypothetical protein
MGPDGRVVAANATATRDVHSPRKFTIFAPAD